MNDLEAKRCSDCMQEIQGVLKKHGCVFEIISMFSSMHGMNFQVRTIPERNIVLADKIPDIKDN